MWISQIRAETATKNKFLPEVVLEKGQASPYYGILTPEDQYKEYQFCEATRDLFEKRPCIENIPFFDLNSFFVGILLGGLVISFATR